MAKKKRVSNEIQTLTCMNGKKMLINLTVVTRKQRMEGAISPQERNKMRPRKVRPL